MSLPTTQNVAWLPSAAYLAGTQQLGDKQNNEGHRGIAVDIDVTNANGGTVTVTIEDIDPVSGVHTVLLVSAGIVANGHTRLVVYPGIAVTANVSANTVLGRRWAIKAVVATATMTLSIGYTLLP